MLRLKILFSILFAVLFINHISGKALLTDDDKWLIIKDIVIKGNKVTKENIILRELVFQKGDTIQKMDLISQIQRSRENILNLSLFNFTNISVEHFPESRIDVIIDVTERWYIWPSPIFEHGERNLSEFLREPRWSRLNYGLWLKWNNFRGRNELLQAKIRLGYREQYVLQYEKPNIGIDENFKILFGYSYSRQNRINYMTYENKPVFFTDGDEYSATTGEASFAFTYRPELYTRHRIRLNYVDEFVGDTIAQLNPDYFGGGLAGLNYFKIDYVYTDDKRDSKVYPLVGDAYKIKLQRTGLGIVKDFDYGDWYLEGAFFYHRKIAPRVYIANAVKGKISSNKDVPYAFKIALGYAEYMTSYEYFVINGTDYFLNKFITKFQIVKPREFTIPFINIKQFSRVHYAVYLNLLADVGYVNNISPHPSNFMVNELQYSTGIGLDIVTYYDQVIRLEYSINRHGISGFFVHAETPFFRW